LNDNYLRLHADFDNYRKRTLKEKSELLRSGSERVLSGILPVVDDFERAIQNLKTADNIDAVKEGIDLIYSKFLSFLDKNGVKVMDTDGQHFDADQHEALTIIPAPSEDMKNKIIDTVEKGYTLDGKVMRFPKVVVAQ
jgi:molecular chaperone GrpE